eukprot:5969990-Pleurochrysis_carterae.AAC.1
MHIWVTSKVNDLRGQLNGATGNASWTPEIMHNRRECCPSDQRSLTSCRCSMYVQAPCASSL